jgi:hypothetical protein
MEILYSYKIFKDSNLNSSSNIFYIFEVKYTNLPTNATKEQKYKWYFYENSVLNLLIFKSMSEGKREFSNEDVLDMNKNTYFSKKDNIIYNIFLSDESDLLYIKNLLLNI